MNLSDYELRVQTQWKVSEYPDLSPQFFAVTGGCLGKDFFFTSKKEKNNRNYIFSMLLVHWYCNEWCSVGSFYFFRKCKSTYFKSKFFLLLKTKHQLQNFKSPVKTSIQLCISQFEFLGLPDVWVWYSVRSNCISNGWLEAS